MFVNLRVVDGVALRKESVDRNCIGVIQLIEGGVALRKESVDRNSIVSASFRAFITSLSARRAWIEIFSSFFIAQNQKVALRKESVDRNLLSP